MYGNFIVVLPHSLEYHYKLLCPYCNRTERFLLNPLEQMGVIRVVRISVDSILDSSRLSENLNVSYSIGENDIAVPTIIDRECGYYFIPFAVSEWEGIKEVVAHMAKALIDHLCRTVKIKYGNSLRVRYLHPNDLLSHPLIRRCVEAV